MRKLRLLSVVLLTLMVSASCGARSGEKVIPADGSASAFVLNRSEVAFTVFVVSNTGRYRLGFVDALRSGRFKIPGEVVAAGGTYTLFAEGRGAYGDVQSEVFPLQAGDIVNWRVPDNNLSVR